MIDGTAGLTVLYMIKKKNLSPSQGLNVCLPSTSQMLLPPGLVGIGAENITTSVVNAHSPQVNSVLETQRLHVRGMTSTPKYV